ncbi:MAG: hypothetical protein WBE65_01765 [Steroidobacteraceae bacterium]
MLNPEERAERWLKVSIGLARFEERMWPLLLQLGRIDVRLIQADETWSDRFLDGGLSGEDGANLHEHITLSFLWVLGAYEFVRTLCARVKTDAIEKTPEEVRNVLLQVKHRFARVRIPLAKMEPASAFAGEDWPIAYPGLKRGVGVAWQLNPSTAITRRELSDVLLEALELRRLAFLRYQATQQESKRDDNG